LKMTTRVFIKKDANFEASKLSLNSLLQLEHPLSLSLSLSLC
jgi:hypothetical protein